jgi:hypothetical protein
MGHERRHGKATQAALLRAFYPRPRCTGTVFATPTSFDLVGRPTPVPTVSGVGGSAGGSECVREALARGVGWRVGRSPLYRQAWHYTPLE